MIKRFGVLVMAVLLPMGIALATPGTAVAAACWDRGCNGGDPQSSGCAASGITVATVPVNNPTGQTYGYVDLRYSNSCGSNWSRTRVLSNLAPAGAVGSTVYNNYCSSSHQCDPPENTYYQDGYTSYSRMLGGAAEKDSAYGFIVFDYGSGTGQTGWY